MSEPESSPPAPPPGEVSPVPPPGGASAAPTGAPPPPPPPGEPVHESLAGRALGWLGGHGLGRTALGLLGAGLALVAALCLALEHQGLGGGFGLLALLASELAAARQVVRGDEGEPFGRAWTVFVDLVLVGGIALALEGGGRLLASGALLLAGWLPHLDAVRPVASGRAAPSLWRRGDRMAVLAAGAILGRLPVALVLYLVVGALDAWVRLDRLRDPTEPRPGPPFVSALLDDDGRLLAAVRWGSLVLALLLLLVLPQTEGWRV